MSIENIESKALVVKDENGNVVFEAKDGGHVKVNIKQFEKLV